MCIVLLLSPNNRVEGEYAHMQYEFHTSKDLQSHPSIHGSELALLQGPVFFLEAISMASGCAAACAWALRVTDSA
jgi:hypothetical protein